MHALEFAMIVLWLLAPALVLGWALLLLFHRIAGSNMRFRFWRAALLMAVGGMAIAIALAAFGPAWIAVRDIQVLGWGTMWAPMGFLAVALALPFAIWLASVR